MRRCRVEGLGRITSLTLKSQREIGGASALSQTVSITLDGRPMTVAAGTSVAAAILRCGQKSRTSVRGEPRQPLCGMGICYECRAQVDGKPYQRTCQMVCQEGMEIATG